MPARSLAENALDLRASIHPLARRVGAIDTDIDPVDASYAEYPLD
jgi:hypothetical protein